MDFPWISRWIFPKDLMSQLERLEELRPGTAKRLKARSMSMTSPPEATRRPGFFAESEDDFSVDDFKFFVKFESDMSIF